MAPLQSKGFTFTEILIVLAIIAGITVVVLSQAGSAVVGGNISKARADVASLSGALERYRTLDPVRLSANVSLWQLDAAGLLPEHMSAALNNPSIPRGQFGIGTINPWGGSYYIARLPGTGTGYVIGVDLRTVTDTGRRLAIMERLDEVMGVGAGSQTVPCTDSWNQGNPACGAGSARKGTQLAWGIGYR